jgi:hypothetical protein
MNIALEAITIDGGTQSRIQLNEQTVQEYTDAMREGMTFPPIVVFHDGSTHWLADGFHRFMAARAANKSSLEAAVHQGTRRDAVLYSVGANAAHGLPRTNADKRRAVTLLLQDEEWAAWSDREIARRCCVGHHLVAAVREGLSGGIAQIDRLPRKVERSGTVYSQRTENIGRSGGSDSVEREAALPPPPPQQIVHKSRGVALGYAQKAITCLKEIPVNDGLRQEALDDVARWIDHNR